MPTVLRVGGLRVVIYPNDHPPAHVHVLGPGWLVVIHLFGRRSGKRSIAANAKREGPYG
jgi:hypothetical protein